MPKDILGCYCLRRPFHDVPNNDGALISLIVTLWCAIVVAYKAFSSIGQDAIAKAEARSIELALFEVEQRYCAHYD